MSEPVVIVMAEEDYKRLMELVDSFHVTRALKDACDCTDLLFDLLRRK